MTRQEYMATPEGLGYNLLDGICCHEEPTVEHQVIVANVLDLFRRYARATGFGRALPAINVDLDERNQPAPDVCLVSRQRYGRLHGRALHGTAPDICVEVLSPSTARYDRGRKAELYALYACLEYWLVDGAGRRVEVYRPGPNGGRFVHTGTFGPGESFASAAASGLHVEVDQVFDEG
jgi:Uma2 family endonuclease